MKRLDLLKEFRANGNYLPNDPRNTQVGRFIRATSLDELPQLFNVIRGELSLVGPRALIPKDLAEYKKRHTILSVKSGITGLAQVSGRNNISIEERRKLDVYYVQNWSFWLDLIILLKTFRAILSREDGNKSPLQ
jgi:lipopolysaccharide/colanic/teichoic acid biosynthesis glycosyltransferase